MTGTGIFSKRTGYGVSLNKWLNKQNPELCGMRDSFFVITVQYRLSRWRRHVCPQNSFAENAVSVYNRGRKEEMKKMEEK